MPMPPVIVHVKKNKNDPKSIVILNKKYVDGAEFTHGDLAAGYMAKGGSTYANGGAVGNKTWIVNIAMPTEKGTRLREEEIVLGRLSNEFDVQQVLKRKSPDWFANGKVLSIVEKKADGGSTYADGGEINALGSELVSACDKDGKICEHQFRKMIGDENPSRIKPVYVGEQRFEKCLYSPHYKLIKN